MVFERKQSESIDFIKPCGVKEESILNCLVDIGWVGTGRSEGFKYLGAALDKCGDMEGREQSLGPLIE